MNEYLRDFVNENVGEECGGAGDLTNPTTMQMQLNEALRRLDRLEAGIGFTISISDQITLPFTLINGKFTSLIPTSGTITMAAVMASKVGETDGLESFTITVHKASTTTNSVKEINHTEKVNSATFSIPVYSGEWVEITATPYSYSSGGHGSPGDDDYDPPTTTTSDTTLIACFAILTLPAKVLGVNNAGS